MSLVSAWGRNRCYSSERIEKVERSEIIDSANIHADFVHITEKMVGYEKRLSEYPTLSAISLSARSGGNPP